MPHHGTSTQQEEGEGHREKREGAYMHGKEGGQEEEGRERGEGWREEWREGEGGGMEGWREGEGGGMEGWRGHCLPLGW